MRGIKSSNITAVVANWLSAQNTLNAVLSFRKFYPDMKLIIVDDDSNEKDKSEFLLTYNSHSNNPDLMFDPDTAKLEHLPHSTLLKVAPHKHQGRGEGNAIDLAMEEMDTDWMFHFHSDYRFLKGGAVEKMAEKAVPGVAGVGEAKTKLKGFPALSGVIELINVKAGKEHQLSYKPVVVHLDGSTTPFPGPAGDGYAIAAGAYYTGRLCQLGYRLVILNGIVSEHGIHLRWEGDLEKWKSLF